MPESSTQDAVIILQEPQVTLRSVTPQDAQMLFAWRNSEAVYPHMLTNRPVSWQEHVNWLDSIRHSHDRYWVIHYAGTPIGMVKVGMEKAPHELSIGLYIAKQEYRGKGVGGMVIDYITAYARTLPGCVRVTSVVRHENQPSLRLFTRKHFTVHGEDSIATHLQLLLER